MARIREILEYLFSFAPQAWKEDWDNVGLLCGHMEKEVSKALVALDVTLEVAQEAKNWDAGLIVSHHPLLFSANSLSDETAQGKLLLYLAANDIAVISMHTNLDSAFGGVNDVLAQRLGLENVRTLDGEAHGIGRIGEVCEQGLADFAAFVRKRLGAGGVRYADGGRSVHHVAVGGGACMDFLAKAIEAGCDTFVTGDVKYHQFQAAKAKGINLIDAGHFPTEDPICAVLCERLQEKFSELITKKSEIHCDCVKFVSYRC